MTSQQLRLNKFLAERLGVSRREADDLISAGKVTIDGKPASLGARIDTSNIIDKKPRIFCDGKKVSLDTDYLYLAFFKPVGYVCSRRAQGKAPTLYNLLPKKYYKLKTVGRLDKDSSGLILLTNDGDFAFQMTHPKFRKNKIYEVELNRPLEPLHQQIISNHGVMLDDGPSQFKVINDTLSNTPNLYTVILTEGRNRQIRRTFSALGYKVIKLHRIQFGKYELGDLKPGELDRKSTRSELQSRN